MTRISLLILLLLLALSLFILSRPTLWDKLNYGKPATVDNELIELNRQ